MKYLRWHKIVAPIVVVGIAVHNAASFQFHGSMSTGAAASVASRICVSPAQSCSFLADRVPMYAPRISSPTSEKQFLTMGAKGDGKKKRKKKSDSPTPSPQPAPSQPVAQRVSNDINIPIRRQIQYGKINKQIRESGTNSFRQKKLIRTKYRRSWDEEEVELKAEERRRKGQVSRSLWISILVYHFATSFVFLFSFNRIPIGTSFSIEPLHLH